MQLEYRVLVRNGEPVIMRVITHDDNSTQEVADSGAAAVQMVGKAGTAALVNELRQLVVNQMQSVDINSHPDIVFNAGHFLNRAGIILQDIASGLRQLEQ